MNDLEVIKKVNEYLCTSGGKSEWDNSKQITAMERIIANKVIEFTRKDERRVDMDMLTNAEQDGFKRGCLETKEKMIISFLAKLQVLKSIILSCKDGLITKKNVTDEIEALQKHLEELEK